MASKLTIEQQFTIATFNRTADEMSREQAIDMLKFLHKHNILQSNAYKELIKHQWNIGETNESDNRSTTE